ncbi:MAG TPA: hypothetical protein VHO47_05060 [Candidatus Babeliales bacterium]|nr:hypothetical protein [Candidatus Babeliales bacterium]
MLILIYFLLFNLTLNILGMNQDEKISLHTGSTVSKKTYKDTWQKLEKLAREGHLNNGAQYTLYSLCCGTSPELKSNNLEVLKSLGFPTTPDEYTDDLKKIILATNSLSLSQEYKKKLGSEYNLEFIDPADPCVGFIEDPWD